MMFRPSHAIVGALALMVSACSDNNSVQVANVATVRLVNATDTPVSLVSADTPDSLSATLKFGQASGCLNVQLSNAAAAQLSVRNDANAATIHVTPTLAAGDNLIVVAFAGAAGDLQLATLDSHFVPESVDAGLRFFNGASSVGPLFMQRAGFLTPVVPFGSASSFVSVRADSALITFVDRSGVALDAGEMSLPVGKNSTLVVGPPAPGTVPLRFFTVRSC
jgi:hypothetical protein